MAPYGYDDGAGPGNPVMRLINRLALPPEPIMSAEEFAKLDGFRKVILTCNMPGCGDVVCSHGLLCVKHIAESTHSMPFKTVRQAPA